MLRTLSMFQILEYNFVDVYITDNATEQTPVHVTERRDAIAGFDVVEWICKFSSLSCSLLPIARTMPSITLCEWKERRVLRIQTDGQSESHIRSSPTIRSVHDWLRVKYWTYTEPSWCVIAWSIILPHGLYNAVDLPRRSLSAILIMLFPLSVRTMQSY